MKKVLSFVLCLCMALGMSAFAVSADAEVAEIKNGTVLEFENYAGPENQDMYVFEGTLASGKLPYGVSFWSDYKLEDGTGLSGGGALGLNERIGATGMTFTIPVNITEPGWYHVDLFGTDGGAAGTYLSRYSLTLSDNTITVAGNTQQIFKPDMGLITMPGSDLYYYPICKKTDRVFLTAGEQNIVIEATPNVKGESSGLGIKMVLDCLKFEKMALPSITMANGGVVEMEDQIPYIRYTWQEGKNATATRLEEPLASGKAVMDMAEKTGIRAMEFDIPVYVEDEGWYAVDLIANSSDGQSTSILHIKEDGQEIVNNNKNSGYAGDALLFFGTMVENTYKHYGVKNHQKGVYLTAGEHRFTGNAVEITNQANATKFVADCIKFFSLKETIPAAGKRLEIENYRSYMSRRTKEHTDDKGQTFLAELGGATTGFGSMMTFEKSGYYTVNLHASPYKNNGRSKINVYLGDKLLMDNDNAKYGVYEEYLFSQYLEAWMFTKNEVYIKAGTYNFSVEVLARDPNSTSNLCAWAGDYLEFVPAEDSASLAGSSVSVKAYYGEEIDETVLIALYSGKEMVGFTSYDAIDETIIEETVPYVGTKAPDTAKVMVWKDLDSLTPLETVRVLPIK